MTNVMRRHIYLEENKIIVCILLFDISKLIENYSGLFLGIYESKAVFPAKEVPKLLNKT